jgi:hypothetical protein
MCLPPLPTHIQPNGAVCFYGYDVLSAWLINYARAYLQKDFAAYDNTAIMIVAANILQIQTGIKTLELKIACVDPDPNASRDTIVPSGKQAEQWMVPVLSICTTGPGSYRNRPKQSQVDQLSEIVGKQPKWWVKNTSWYSQ